MHLRLQERKKVSMKSYFYHVQINIDFTNVSFYKDLLSFLGWKVIFEETDVIGFRSGKNGDLWFVANLKNEQNDYDKIGVNHVAIRVDTMQAIDSTTNFFKGKNIKTLFETPKHRPEFASNDNETYYQLMFESPDKILFEIVYIGSKGNHH